MPSAQSGGSPARSLFKNIVRGSSIYSLALFVPQIASMVLVPITTRFLNRADYGILGLLEQVGSVFGLLLGASFSAGLGYFYFQTGSSEERRKIVSTTVFGA